MSDFFNSSVGLKMSAEQVGREIVNFMRADSQKEYKITIGTDSLRTHNDLADFVTAIVVHRVGRGGRYFWRRIDNPGKFHTLRDRITHEVLISLEAAKEFLSELKQMEAPKFDFEIHIDVGENGASKVMIQELVGMIRANNFEVKTKPESYAASNVADRHV
ncbi:MAG: hypothetical protein UY12_C0002G0021 [Parcubacteria group bacterium GW2011_GWA2_47_8b]|nr:MAG: hypothetical protein UY12_C0002G0021 [Parcubacteria group bacterium GW2011_GWA2_47_8b]KKU92530.1 MAG: hypothetical protein UY24_C0038G0011 [Parcubacteria group bacterium GW2011_GWA1_48_11b]